MRALQVAGQLGHRQQIARCLLDGAPQGGDRPARFARPLPQLAQADQVGHPAIAVALDLEQAIGHHQRVLGVSRRRVEIRKLRQRLVIAAVKLQQARVGARGALGVGHLLGIDAAQAQEDLAQAIG